MFIFRVYFHFFLPLPKSPASRGRLSLKREGLKKIIYLNSPSFRGEGGRGMR